MVCIILLFFFLLDIFVYIFYEFGHKMSDFFKKRNDLKPKI